MVTTRLILLLLFRACTVHGLLPSVVRSKDSLLTFRATPRTATATTSEEGALGRRGYFSVFVRRDGLQRQMPNGEYEALCTSVSSHHSLYASGTHYAKI